MKLDIRLMCSGKIFDRVIQLLFVKVPKFESQLYTLFQLPANAHTGKKKVIIQVLQLLPHTWQPQTEMPAPGFVLISPS